jgi:hypothetical protein
MDVAGTDDSTIKLNRIHGLCESVAHRGAT